jgi:hypothetical protein
VRLALLDASRDGGSALAVEHLRRGLAGSPEDPSLNFLMAMFLMDLGRFEEAVGPASRYLARLLETRISHQDWNSAVALLAAALDRKTPWPQDAAARAQRLQDLRGGFTLSPSRVRSSHGCTDGMTQPTQVPVHFRPKLAY